LDSAEVALQALELVRPKADARDITLEYELDAADRFVPDRQATRVVADKRALRQVFLNLLSNACKYSPRGGRVKMWSRDAGAVCQWHVSDDGPGIAPEFQTQLFHPFERGAKRTGNQDGVGLGLAISKKLMESMRGTLTFQSQVGQGSTFSIELPRAESESVKPSNSQPLPSLFGELDVPHPIEAAVMPHALLLYVEDDPVNGLLMQEFVARTPHLKMHIAPTIGEGLESALKLQPDLILLDMHLPDGSGRDFIEQLRGVVQGKVPKVVILSADAMADRLELIRTLHVQGYWTKPLDFGLLRRRLQEVLA
jgi:CheY-like chemotaxis protein